MKFFPAPLRMRSVLLGLALLLLAAALFGGLQRLHSSRVRYNAMSNAAADMGRTTSQLSSLKWEVLAERDAESDETKEARALVAAGNGYLARIGDLGSNQDGAELLAVWKQYSAGVVHLIGLVRDDDIDVADEFEESALEPTEEVLLSILGSVREDAIALDARAEQVEAVGAIGLIIGALAGFLAALTLSQRRRSSAAVAEVLRSARDKLRHQATHDALTGLANRRLFTEAAAVQTALQQTTGTCFAVLLLDLDQFKVVNDTLGHHSGDEMLKAVAQRLHGAMRGNDLVARIGGDEFAILVTDVRDEETPALVAARILDALMLPVTVHDLLLAVRASIGIAVSPLHGDDADLLLRRADVAMYQAKRDGNTFVMYDPDEDASDSKKLALLLGDQVAEA